MKRNRRIFAVVLIIALSAIGFLIYNRAMARETPSYRFAQIERGDMQMSVSATGTLNALKTVSVGTQVSGQVSGVFVDFNDHVKKGQLLARIDATLAQQAVADAQASLQKAEAQAVFAQRDYARNKELTTDGLLAKSAFEQSQSSQAVAAADVKSAQVALDRARQNLSYTNIYAPIDGVIVQRNVDAGQTVAASLSAPQLFLIANDLSRMQILAQVDESDIAQIHQGQPVQFTVQALTGQPFNGNVEQVRLQPTTTDNVVNYTVVVSAGNQQNKLLPGMTAKADFRVKSAQNVLKVPNAALRFRPADATATAAKTQSSAQATSTTTGAQRSGSSRGSRTGGQRTGGFGTLYTLDSTGALKAIRVRTGISDGTMTEVSGNGLQQGMKVVAGSTSTTAQTASASGPFGGGGTQQSSGGGRPTSGAF